jgi:ferredoxin
MSKPKITVDLTLCTGCGTCESLCPGVFEIREEKCWVLKPEGCDECNCEEVVNSCPTQAIKVEGLEIKVERKPAF